MTYPLSPIAHDAGFFLQSQVTASSLVFMPLLKGLSKIPSLTIAFWTHGINFRVIHNRRLARAIIL